MAMARANCRCKTCGTEFEKIALKRNRAEADSWERWAVEYYDECDDCTKKRLDAKHAEEAAEAAKMAEEIGLPALEGSTKQIQWAESIRADLYKDWQEYEDSRRQRFERGRLTQEQLDNVIITSKYIFGQTSASWWIDHKGYEARAMYGFCHEKAETEARLQEEPKSEPAAIIEPENKTHETVCTVSITEQAITVKSAYDPAMPPIVKALGYKWDGTLWGKPLSYKTEDPVDRAAEIANKLLTAGFPVVMPEEAKEKAIAGTYSPEWQRWVSWRTDKKCFEVSGDVRLTGLPGAKGQLVPLDSYDAVEEFARIHDYRLSPGAKQAIAERKARTVKVDVTKGASAEYKEEDVRSILQSSRDVLDDLKEGD